MTHATPASAYAHSAERYWENDAEMNVTRYGVEASYNQQFKCRDIARQLVEDNWDINVSVVIMANIHVHSKCDSKSYLRKHVWIITLKIAESRTQ